jgi:large subunit ribosomal protein L9
MKLKIKKRKREKKVPIMLTEDIKNIGRYGDVIKLKRGYALYLARLQKCIIINKNNKDKLEFFKELNQKRLEKKKEKLIELKEKIERLTFTAYLKIGSNKEVYNSISKNDILSFLKKENISISKNQIELDSPIKEVGTFNIRISLGFDIYANLKIIIKENVVN